MRVNTKKGFTLIELLIVIVIIGILAAIAIPKFANTKERAYVTAMKSDLRNLVTAEEAYFSDNNAYVAGTASNVGGSVSQITGLNYTPSAGITVTVTLVPAAGTSLAGWNASASHDQTAKGCAVQVGGDFSSGVTLTAGTGGGSVTLTTDGTADCTK